MARDSITNKTLQEETEATIMKNTTIEGDNNKLSMIFQPDSGNDLISANTTTECKTEPKKEESNATLHKKTMGPSWDPDHKCIIVLQETISKLSLKYKSAWCYSFPKYKTKSHLKEQWGYKKPTTILSDKAMPEKTPQRNPNRPSIEEIQAAILKMNAPKPAWGSAAATKGYKTRGLLTEKWGHKKPVKKQRSTSK
jgi:hypothetical protein